MVGDFLRQRDGFAFDDGAGQEIADHVVAVGRHRDAAGRREMAGETVAREVCQRGVHVRRVRDGKFHQLGLQLLVGLDDVPDFVHAHLLAAFDQFEDIDGVIQSGRAGIAFVNDAVRADFGDIDARGLLDGGGRPVRADIREHLRDAARQDVADHHAEAVLRIVFRCNDIRRPEAVPVKRRVQHGFRHVEVRIVIRPLTLALRAGRDGVDALRVFDVRHEAALLAVGGVRQFRVAVHQVFHDTAHLDREFLQFVVGHARAAFARLVAVDTFELTQELQAFLHFFRIEEVRLDTACDDAHVNGHRAHAQVVEEHVAADIRTDDAHRHAADRQVVLAAQIRNRRRATRKAEQTRRDEIVQRAVFIFQIGRIHAENRTLLLVHGRRKGLQPHRSGAVRLVQAVCALLPFRRADAHHRAHQFVRIRPAAADPDVRADALRRVVRLRTSRRARAINDFRRDDDVDFAAVNRLHILLDQIIDLLDDGPCLDDVVFVSTTATVGYGRDGDCRNLSENGLVRFLERTFRIRQFLEIRTACATHGQLLLEMDGLY